MRISSIFSISPLKAGMLGLFLLIAQLKSEAVAQNGQSDLAGANGDGLSLQSALVGNQPVYAHINPINGQLKFAQLTSSGWSEQVIATGFPVGSSLALAVSPSGLLQMAAVSGNLGSLNYYTRSSTGTWSSEVVRANDVKGSVSLFVGSSETLISFSSISSQDLMLARKSGTSWVTSVVDGSADVVGKESSVGIGPNSLAAIAYLDETNKKLKVAVSLDRANWAIESIDYPGAKFGKLPQLTWLSNSELSILASDVLQDQTVGGQGIYHVQRSATGLWSLEQVGFPAEASQSGRFIGSTDSRNSALIVRSNGLSSIVNAQRAANGLWSGVTAFTAPTGEALSDITAVVDGNNLVNYFARATIASQTFIRRVTGVVLVTTPSPTPSPSPSPSPSPTPTATPTPEPTPEARSGTDTDGDGLLDSEEATLGTNPLLRDTDGDGVLDGEEVRGATNPLSANSFVGSVENKVCSFWTKKKGISQRLNVSNLVSSTLDYNIEISSNAGQLKAIDTRNIAAKTASIVSLDQLIKSSGNLSRGQVCVKFMGKMEFLKATYFETKASAAISLGLKKRKAPAKLLEHVLTSGARGNLELSFKALAASRGERLSSELNLQNTSVAPVRGQISGIDSRGKKTATMNVTINPGSLLVVAPSKLKLTSSGKVLWTPATSIAEVRAVYEQELERKVGKQFTAVKISRKDGNKKK